MSLHQHGVGQKDHEFRSCQESVFPVTRKVPDFFELTLPIGIEWEDLQLGDSTV